MEEFFAYFLAYRFLIYILVVTLFLGLQLIQKLPKTFYSPFLSVMNFLSCTLLALEIKFLGNSNENDFSSLLFGFFAILFLSISLVGNYFLTEAQIRTFRKSKK